MKQFDYQLGVNLSIPPSKLTTGMLMAICLMGNGNRHTQAPLLDRQSSKYVHACRVELRIRNYEAMRNAQSAHDN